MNRQNRANSIAIVIPTLNAGPDFRLLLDGLYSQTIKTAEIIIIDSQSSDNTVETAKDYGCRIIPIKQTEFNHGATRNLGARMADTEFVVFMTQDAIPADQKMLEELIRPFEQDQKTAISFARHIPRETPTGWKAFTENYNYPEQSLRKTKADLPTLGIKTFSAQMSAQQ